MDTSRKLDQFPGAVLRISNTQYRWYFFKRRNDLGHEEDVSVES